LVHLEQILLDRRNRRRVLRNAVEIKIVLDRLLILRSLAETLTRSWIHPACLCPTACLDKQTLRHGSQLVKA